MFWSYAPVFFSEIRVNKNQSNSITRPKLWTVFITLMTTGQGYRLNKSSVQTLWLSEYLIRCSEQGTGWHSAQRGTVRISGRRKRLFFKASKSTLRISQLPIRWVLWEYMRCGVELLHHSSPSRLKVCVDLFIYCSLCLDCLHSNEITLFKFLPYRQHRHTRWSAAPAVPMTNNNQLMCFAEITALCSEIGMTSLNTLCWQNAVFPNVMASGTWS
jgi:hypothetical protein